MSIRLSQATRYYIVELVKIGVMDKLQWEYDIVVTRADKEHKVALNGVCDIKVNWFWQIEKKK